ncbi:MAG: LysR family transcriptional regulator, partial [Hyphomicrobiales bacterium]
FKAVIEGGTVSEGAKLINVTQPAMSKLIAHLEYDTGLKLFDRVKGRLAPTVQAMRFYKDVDRILSGLRELENAVDAIRRDEHGRLAIGVMPALSVSFVQRATSALLSVHKDVFCTVETQSSQWIVDAVVARKLDVGLVNGGFDNPYAKFEPMMEHPLVCIMPKDHPLASKTTINPHDLEEVPLVSFPSDVGRRVSRMFEEHHIMPRDAIVANTAPTLCQFVAAGHGVSLIHPLYVHGQDDRLAIRKFEPAILDDFQLCRAPDSRNAPLIDAFVNEVRSLAAEISKALRG